MIRRMQQSGMLLAVLSIFLTGCWDIKEIQDINYMTAIGVDYREGKYVVYAQMLDFSGVAKQESGKPVDQIPIWVGKGSGRTMSDALMDIYSTNQQRLSWGQVTALVLTESVLVPERMTQIFDMTNRSQEIRYTKWVFGTKGELAALFTTTPFFKLSPLHSLLHEPMESYEQASFIRPMQFNEFIIHYREKAATVVLPSLSISGANWSEDMRQHPVLEINGAFLLKDRVNKGWLKRDELLGIRWLTGRNTQAPIIVGPENDPAGSVNMQKPQASIELLPAKDKVAYHIKLKVHGMVKSIYKDVSAAEIKKMTEDSLRKELLTTFRNTVALQADPYQLSLHLYQHKPKLWKKLDGAGKTITRESLEEDNIDVDVDLRFWGQRKQIRK